MLFKCFSHSRTIITKYIIFLLMLSADIVETLWHPEFE